MYVNSDNPPELLLKLSLQNPDVFYKTSNGDVIHNGKVIPKAEAEKMVSIVTEHPHAVKTLMVIYNIMGIITLRKFRRKLFGKNKHASEGM